MRLYLYYEISHSTLGYSKMSTLRYSMQEEDILEHSNINCQLCAPHAMLNWVSPSINRYRMFFVQTATWPPAHAPRTHQTWQQNNQLPTKSHDELKNNSNILTYNQLTNLETMILWFLGEFCNLRQRCHDCTPSTWIYTQQHKSNLKFQQQMLRICCVWVSCKFWDQLGIICTYGSTKTCLGYIALKSRRWQMLSKHSLMVWL